MTFLPCGRRWAFGNTIQPADRTLICVYSFCGDDNKTHVEAGRGLPNFPGEFTRGESFCQE